MSIAVHGISLHSPPRTPPASETCGDGWMKPPRGGSEPHQRGRAKGDGRATEVLVLALLAPVPEAAGVLATAAAAWGRCAAGACARSRALRGPIRGRSDGGPPLRCSLRRLRRHNRKGGARQL